MEFRLLGPVEAYRQGRPVDLGRRRERCLLCLLLLETGRTVPVERLLDLLWDGSPPETGRGQLRVNVSRLRSRLDAAGTGVRITARGGGYLVDADPDSIDVHRFRAGLQQARQIHDAAARTAALTTALALWRGPLMADVATDQLRARVGAGLDDLRLSAAELRAESALAAGQHDGLVADLTALVAEQPGRERLVGLLMLALYRSGRPAEALAAYRAARRVLVDEFGLEPGAPLRLLHEQILRDDPAIAAPGTPVAAGAARRYLPRDIGDFTGRTGELAWLAEAARDTSGAVPVAVVVGPAGVGKTALAVRFAHRIATRFGDGQLYLDLRGFAPGPPVRPIDALARLLRALGVEPDRVPADPVEAAGLYRSLLVERRVMVLLDNAGSAEQIRPLLPGGPGCLALVTSRDRLTGLVARDGARRLTLDVLEPAESLALLGRIVGRHRLDAEPDAATDLVELCDRLPLALRIAAATLADHPHRPIAEQVAALAHGDRLGALQVPGDAHGGVRAAFNQSYAALGPDARRLYRQLGLVPGPDLTAETAAAVARTGTGEAAKLLDRLAGAHLVDTHANGRYGMHDLLRLYARELAAAEDPDADRQATLDRLYDHYLDRVAEAARLLYPQKLRLPRPPRPAEVLSPIPAGAAGVGDAPAHAEPAAFDADAQASVLPGPVPVRAHAGPVGRGPAAFDEHAQASAWLDAERANLVAAVTHAAEHGPRPAAWLLADSLRGYFWLSMHTVDWLATARAGLAAAEADGDLRARAAAQLSLGDLHWRQGEHRRAIERYTRALALARRAGWRECQAAVLGNLGNTYRLSGQPRRAANHVIQALALNRQAGLLAGEAVNLGNLGVAYFELGRLQQAANWYGEALGRHQKAGSRSGEAIMLGNLAEVRHAQGHFDQAREHLDRSLALTREIGDRANEAEVLRILAGVGHDTGRHDEAFELARTAVSLAAGTGHHRFEALTLTTLATIHRDLGQHQRAIDGYRHAIDLAAGAGDRYPHVGALLGLAVADQHLGRHEPALTHAGEALGLAREAGFRMLEGQARTVLAAVHLGQHRRDVAVREAHRALAVHHETGHRQGAADTHLVLAHALRHTDPADARIHQRQAAALLADIGLAPPARLRALGLS